MIIEKIVFGVLSIALFTIFFLKMIGKNNRRKRRKLYGTQNDSTDI